MRVRRSLEKSTANRRARFFQSHSAYTSDQTKDGHDQKVNTRLLPMTENCNLTSKSACNEETCTSRNNQPQKDCEDLEKLRYMNVLQMMQNKLKDATPTSHGFNKKDSLPLRKRSTFKLPMRAFMTWECTERPKMWSKFPTTSRKEMSILLGLMWRRMGTGEKKAYYLITDRKARHREEKVTSVDCSQETSEGQQTNVLNAKSRDTSHQCVDGTPLQMSVMLCSSSTIQLSESLDKTTQLQSNNNNANFNTKPHQQMSGLQTLGPLYPKVAPAKHINVTTSYALNIANPQQNIIPRHCDIQNPPEHGTFDDSQTCMSLSESISPSKKEQTMKKTNVYRQKQFEIDYPTGQQLGPRVENVSENQHVDVGVTQVERCELGKAADSSDKCFLSNKLGILSSSDWSLNNEYHVQHNQSISSVSTMNSGHSISSAPYVNGNQSIPGLQSVNCDRFIQNLQTFDYDCEHSVNSYFVPHLQPVTSNHSTASVNYNNSDNIHCVDNSHSISSVRYNNSDMSITSVHSIDSSHSIADVPYNNSDVSIISDSCVDNNHSIPRVRYNNSDSIICVESSHSIPRVGHNNSDMSINSLHCIDSDYSIRSLHTVDGDTYIPGVYSSSSDQSISGMVSSDHSIMCDGSIDTNHSNSSAQPVGSDHYLNSSYTSIPFSRWRSGYYPVVRDSGQILCENISSAGSVNFTSSGIMSNTVSNTLKNECHLVSPIMWTSSKTTPEGCFPAENNSHLKNISFHESCHEYNSNILKSFVRHMDTNVAEFDDYCEKNSNVKNKIKDSGNNLQSYSTKHHDSGVSHHFYHSVKPVELTDDDYDEDEDDDDEDDFPHLVIDDSREYLPPDSYLDWSADKETPEGVQNMVKRNSNKDTIELKKLNSTALHENALVENNSLPKTSNGIVNQVVLPCIKQSTRVSQPVQTVTYVYRKNQENMYSTTVIPNTGRLTSPPEMQSLTAQCGETTKSPVTKSFQANQTHDTTIPQVTTVQANQTQLETAKTAVTKTIQAIGTQDEITISAVTKNGKANRTQLKNTKTFTNTSQTNSTQLETAIPAVTKTLQSKQTPRESAIITVTKPVTVTRAPAKTSTPAVTKAVQTNRMPCEVKIPEVTKLVQTNGTIKAAVTKAVQTNRLAHESTTVTKTSQANQTQISCSLSDEGESDFADVNTMCENILNQKSLVPALGKIPDHTPEETSTVSENHNKSYPRYTGSTNSSISSYKKHNIFPHVRKTPSSTHSTLHCTGYMRTPTPPISNNVTSNSGRPGWNSVPSHKPYFIHTKHPLPYMFSKPIPKKPLSLPLQNKSQTGNSHSLCVKENGKSDLLQELPLILQHCKENKLLKPTIIGPLTASALETMLAMSARPGKLVQTTEQKSNNIPVSKYVPGTREMYRDTGMGNVNKSGNIKRPMNAFMVWARSYRGHLTMLYPNESNKLVSQRLGDIWKKMSLDDKQPYYIEADRIKRQHRKDYPDWKYKPNTPKSRPEKMGTHDVLWARFIGANESLDESSKRFKLQTHKTPSPPPAAYLGKVGPPLVDVQSKENTPPSNLRKRNYSTSQQSDSQETNWKIQLTGKSNDALERSISCKRIKFNETEPLAEDIGHLITLGDKDVKNELPNVNKAYVSQEKNQYSESTTLNTSNNFTAQGSQMMNHFSPASSEMMALPKENGTRPYLVKTNMCNTIKPLGVSEHRNVSCNGSSISEIKTSAYQTYAMGSRVGHNDSGMPVQFAIPRNNVGNNNPWKYQLPYRWPAPLPQALSSQWSTPLPQCMSGEMIKTMHSTPATEATNLTNLYRITPNRPQETELTRLVPGGVIQVSQDMDIRNLYPSGTDGHKTSDVQGRTFNNNLITTFPSSSYSSIWGDSASYVSSVLKSPHSMYFTEPHSSDIVSNPVQPQLPPFVRVPSTSDSSRMVTMPVISAEMYKRLLEKGEANGNYLANSMSLVPLQTGWVQSVVTSQCSAVSLNNYSFPVTTSSSYSVPLSSEKVANGHLVSR